MMSHFLLNLLLYFAIFVGFVHCETNFLLNLFGIGTSDQQQQEQSTNSLHTFVHRTLYWNLSCPIEWSKYSCIHQGQTKLADLSLKTALEHNHYSLWKALTAIDKKQKQDKQAQAKAKAYNNAKPSTFLQRRIVMIGDSLIRQVFIALTCRFAGHIVDQRITWATEANPWPCHNSGNCIRHGLHSGFDHAAIQWQEGGELHFYPLYVMSLNSDTDSTDTDPFAGNTNSFKSSSSASSLADHRNAIQTFKSLVKWSKMNDSLISHQQHQQHLHRNHMHHHTDRASSSSTSSPVSSLSPSNDGSMGSSWQRVAGISYLPFLNSAVDPHVLDTLIINAGVHYKVGSESDRYETHRYVLKTLANYGEVLMQRRRKEEQERKKKNLREEDHTSASSSVALPQLIYMTTPTQHFDMPPLHFDNEGKLSNKSNKRKMKSDGIYRAPPNIPRLPSNTPIAPPTPPPKCLKSVDIDPRRSIELEKLKSGKHVHAILDAIDMKSLGQLHIGQGDCTHYCMPGIPDISAHQLLNLIH
jgi:hypothetical protein